MCRYIVDFEQSLAAFLLVRISGAYHSCATLKLAQAQPHDCYRLEDPLLGLAIAGSLVSEILDEVALENLQ